MIPQNLITALPFWDAQNKQTFRQSYCASNVGAINCRYARLLPFTILNTPAAAPNFVYLVQQDGERAISLGSLITVDTATEGGLGYSFYSAGADINPLTTVTEYSSDGSDPAIWDSFGSTTWGSFVCDGGYYYLEISIGSTRYYSELMRLTNFPEFSDNPTNDNTSMVRIEGTNACAVGDLPATLNANKLFVDAKTVAPKYLITKGVTKDGQEEETDLWVKFKKRYTVSFLAIESVADWVATLPIYGASVNVTDQYGFQSSVTDIEVDVSWPDDLDGCLARVDFSYAITYFSHTGCC